MDQQKINKLYRVQARCQYKNKRTYYVLSDNPEDVISKVKERDEKYIKETYSPACRSAVSEIVSVELVTKGWKLLT